MYESSWICKIFPKGNLHWDVMAKELHLNPWARAMHVLCLRVLSMARLKLSCSWNNAKNFSLDPDLKLENLTDKSSLFHEL